MKRAAGLVVVGMCIACWVPGIGFATPSNPVPGSCTVDPLDKKKATCPMIEVTVVAKSDGCHLQFSVDSLDIPKGTKDVPISWGFAAGTSARYVFNLLLNNGITFDDKDKEFTIDYANGYAIGVTNKNNKKNPHPYVVHVADAGNFFSSCATDPTIVNQGQ